MTSFVSSPKMRAWADDAPAPRRCAFVIGESNGSRTRHCSETRTRGAYCDEHAALCYERARPGKRPKVQTVEMAGVMARERNDHGYFSEDVGRQGKMRLLTTRPGVTKVSI